MAKRIWKGGRTIKTACRSWQWSRRPSPDRSEFRQALYGLAAWLFFSPLPLALCQVSAYISLVTAVLAGVVLGVVLVKKPLLSPVSKLGPVNEHL